MAAGFDEQAKQDYNNKLNLLYADVLTETGKLKLARGEPVAAEEIDQIKLRKLIQSPTQALVKRVINGLVSMEKALKAELAASPSPQGTADADNLDLQAGHGAGPAKALKLLSQDLQTLREGKLDELDPDGVAAAVLLGAEKSVVSEQLINDIAKKYTSREFSAQTAQRIGQMFHLGVLGSAASSVIGKASSAAQGGTRNVPTAQTLAISALSGTMATVGALNQHTAITVKNNRREGDTDIGLKQQVLRGVMGGQRSAVPASGDQGEPSDQRATARQRCGTAVGSGQSAHPTARCHVLRSAGRAVADPAAGSGAAASGNSAHIAVARSDRADRG